MYKLFELIPVFSPYFQEGGPYSGTSAFQRNFFFGGIGLWFIFFLLALIALIWVFYDSQRRKLDATAWRFAAIIGLILVLPAMFFKFTVVEENVNSYFSVKEDIANLERYQPDGWIDEVDRLNAELNNNYPVLTGYVEIIMFLGLLGGLGGVGVAIAYFITYQGASGEVPVTPMRSATPDYYIPPPPPERADRPSRGSRPVSSKPVTNAWLIAQDGKSYQLCEGTTIVGRSSSCDIQITNDTKLSKQHAKFIQQANGKFKLIDIGSTNGTFVNGKRLRGDMILDPNDKIRLGDNTTLTFKA